MDRKLKNTIALIIIFVLILGAGGIFIFVYQKGKIDKKEKQINDLSINSVDTEKLMEQLNMLKKRVAELDSILALRKYNIPSNLDQSSLYDFVNRISFSFDPKSFVNIEYIEIGKDPNFYYYKYNITGTAYFNELFYLIYAIEQSRELKKVTDCSIDNIVSVDDDGVAGYKVSFKLMLQIYFSDSDRFTSSAMVENNLKPNALYDVFYPLIRNEIPPNIDNLPDVQSAQLLALIPDGAFIADSRGNTYLLWEGDKVYLGYLTEIDYQKNEVHFILNKGGIIEKVKLTLEKEKKSSE
ncbi:MAG: hypothetical protein CVV23_01480 [Ignavibacteriae bacterium HGW-Ignavibacteriae-2]|jgi:hypothetical protein|nr:hypothetical protein [Bacteroidota bacterium]PKL90039.1 MAG: hypothetical protein CVV23_01480 [Ignavibacteriae bacterium HGW-Ignavibacteriae-2]